MNQLKLLLTIILWASSFSITSGQSFAPLNAKWHFQKYCTSPPWLDNCGYFTVEAVQDTTVNGKYATIFENRDLGSLIPDAQLIVREDSNKIYFFENNQFKLLYDFNMSTGDTLTFSIPHNWHYYDFSCGDSPDTSRFAQVVIDSTAILTIDGRLLKSLYTSPIYNNDTTYYYSWQLGQIVERIGSHNGIFGFSTTQCLGGFFGNFRCYNDSLINYKTVTEDCDFVSGLDKIIDKNTISIYPNPTGSKLLIHKYINYITEYKILSITGQFLLERKNLFSKSEEIDISAFNQGIYVIKIRDDKDITAIQKIIKQNSR